MSLMDKSGTLHHLHSFLYCVIGRYFSALVSKIVSIFVFKNTLSTMAASLRR